MRRPCCLRELFRADTSRRGRLTAAERAVWELRSRAATCDLRPATCAGIEVPPSSAMRPPYVPALAGDQWVELRARVRAWWVRGSRPVLPISVSAWTTTAITPRPRRQTAATTTEPCPRHVVRLQGTGLRLGGPASRWLIAAAGCCRRAILINATDLAVVDGPLRRVSRRFRACEECQAALAGRRALQRPPVPAPGMRNLGGWHQPLDGADAISRYPRHPFGVTHARRGSKHTAARRRACEWPGVVMIVTVPPTVRAWRRRCACVQVNNRPTTCKMSLSPCPRSVSPWDPIFHASAALHT